MTAGYIELGLTVFGKELEYKAKMREVLARVTSRALYALIDLLPEDKRKPMSRTCMRRSCAYMRRVVCTPSASGNYPIPTSVRSSDFSMLLDVLVDTLSPHTLIGVLAEHNQLAGHKITFKVSKFV